MKNLRWDTKTANSQDAIRNGRKPRGQANGLSKLTPRKVKKMRAMREQGYTYTELANCFDVSYAAARNAALGITWAHVD